MKSNQLRKHQPIFQNCVLASGAFAMLALSIVAQGCAQDNNTTKTGTGGESAGTGGSSAGTGGSSSSGTGGASTTGTGGESSTGTGGTTAGTGGATAGTGGASTTATGGSSAGTGGASAGTGGAGGGGTAGPLCVSQTKGGPCLTPTDSCSKNCGPKNAANVNIGSKSLTCVASAYVEGTCDFPAGDLSCFKVSATTAMCPPATASSGVCTATSCVPCSGYTDSAGAAKVGYCHCVNGKWSCGSTKEWPCTVTGTSTTPGGTGC